MSAGIREVAKRAGVSISTVSRVLNNSKPVREDVRNRVLMAVKNLGYVPNYTAQSMVHRRTKTIGIVVPAGASSFNSLAMAGIRQQLVEQGYQSLVCDVHDPMTGESEVRYLDLLSRGVADGIILMHEGQSPAILSILRTVTIPVVIASVEIKGVRLPSIGINDRAAAREAVSYLLSLGHKRIGIVSGGDRIASGRNRTNGYRDALRAHGVPIVPARIVPGRFSLESGYDAAEQLLRNDPSLTAIFAVSDDMAIGVVRFLKDHGYNVPQDVSVIGFDDIAVASYLDPPLTTVRQPISEVGTGAARLLLRILNNEAGILKRTILKHEIIVRGSCRALR